MTFCFILALAASLVMNQSVFAADLAVETRIAGTLSVERMAPVIEAVIAHGLSNTTSYRQMREGEIISNLASASDESNRIDLAILPTPDSGVRLANEGLLSELPIDNIAKESSHWRGEVVALFFDPSVILVRSDRFNNSDLPKDRTELVRFLEDHASELQSRVGLVNIGVDSQSYAYAAQDQLRSPLFWRIAQAFGQLNTRIYNSNAEIVEAIQKQEIDLAYNVPLSEISFMDQQGMTIIMPEDYIVSQPWIVVSPSTSGNPLLIEILHHLRNQVVLKQFPNKAFWDIFENNNFTHTQYVKIGPELLVFLDPIKKTNILETWFQMVTSQ
ncbi:hypothetical protein [Cohaesibacter celericrescens]|uniref:hypothetical protein n=1 Tax=Cohaesibacter celericrescens TaxID=2067669 RepID=UPI003563A357